MFKRFFNRHFFLLWLGQSVSRIGDGAGFIAVMWWVQAETGSAVALGTLAMSKGLVATLLSPLAGVLVDRLDRKKVIVGTDVARGIIYCVLAYMAWTQTLTLPVLIILSCAAVACGQFFYPAVSASVPLLVPDDGLERANALNQVTDQIVKIAGFSAGGIMVALFGVPALLMINGVSFLLSALSETFIIIPKAQKKMQRLSVGLFTDDIADALTYIRENSILVKIIVVAMALNFFAAPLFVLLPMFVSVHMGAGSDIYGYLLSAMMLGGLTGSVILSSSDVVKQNIWAVKWSIVVQGFAFFFLPFLPVGLWWAHACLLAFFGLINTVVNVSFNSVMQRITRPDYMGKVFSLLGTATGALTPVSQGLAGAVAEIITVPAIFVACSIGCSASGAGLALIPDIESFLLGESEEPDSAASAVSSD